LVEVKMRVFYHCALNMKSAITNEDYATFFLIITNCRWCASEYFSTRSRFGLWNLNSTSKWWMLFQH